MIARKKRILRLKDKLKKFKLNLRGFLVGGLGGLIFLGVLTIFLVIFYEVFFWGRIYPGVEVGGISLEGKSQTEALVTFSSWIEDRKFDELKLTLNERSWFIDLKRCVVEYDNEASVKKAYFWGREGDLAAGLRKKYLAVRAGVQLEAIFRLNEEELESQVASIGGSLLVPAVEPEVEVLEATPAGATSRVMVKQGENGRELDEERLLKQIKQRLSFFDNKPIVLPMIELKPKLTEGEVEKARQRAKKLLNKKLVLTTEDGKWELGEKDMINFLNLKGGFDEEKIASYTAELAKTIDKNPQNAAFAFDGVRVTEFRPGKEGMRLNQEETRESLKEKLSGLETVEIMEEKISLEIKKAPPEVKTEEVNNLGIKELLGKGESYFRGSIAGRIHNIDLASSKISGILVKQDEVFSVNQVLGEVSKNTGYQEAYVIKEGKTILGDGGGVCQVSTTLFRAILRAGLPILERRAHAYRVSYYEQGFPVGQDATVWDPSPDFKFKNDTPGYVLVQRVINKANRYLSFEIYGTSDGRKVTITPSKIWDQVAPPPDLYVDDPTLPAGTVKQIDWKAWGAKVSFGWKVTRNEEVLQDRVFYSSYRPWQAIFLRGTGG